MYWSSDMAEAYHSPFPLEIEARTVLDMLSALLLRWWKAPAGPAPRWSRHFSWGAGTIAFVGYCRHVRHLDHPRSHRRRWLPRLPSRQRRLSPEVEPGRRPERSQEGCNAGHDPRSQARGDRHRGYARRGRLPAVRPRDVHDLQTRCSRSNEVRPVLESLYDVVVEAP